MKLAKNKINPEGNLNILKIQKLLPICDFFFSLIPSHEIQLEKRFFLGVCVVQCIPDDKTYLSVVKNGFVILIYHGENELTLAPPAMDSW